MNGVSDYDDYRMEAERFLRGYDEIDEIREAVNVNRFETPSFGI